VVNAINSDNSVQVVCDCQQSGIVKIESDLASPSDDDELFNETSMLDDEVAADEDAADDSGSGDADKTGEKSFFLAIVFTLFAYLL